MQNNAFGPGSSFLLVGDEPRVSAGPSLSWSNDFPSSLGGTIRHKERATGANAPSQVSAGDEQLEDTVRAALGSPQGCRGGAVFLESRVCPGVRGLLCIRSPALYLDRSVSVMQGERDVVSRCS